MSDHCDLCGRPVSRTCPDCGYHLCSDCSIHHKDDCWAVLLPQPIRFGRLESSALTVEVTLRRDHGEVTGGRVMSRPVVGVTIIPTEGEEVTRLEFEPENAAQLMVLLHKTLTRFREIEPQKYITTAGDVVVMSQSKFQKEQ